MTIQQMTIQQPTAPPTPATPAQRRMVAAIFVGMGLLVLGLLWVVVFDVATRYRLTCTRSADGASCAVVRERLGGDLAYQVAIPPGARAEVQTTNPRRGEPRVFLNMVAAGDRTFLVEYSGPDPESAAYAAASRLDASFRGDGADIVREVVGSPRGAWGLVVACIALIVGIAVGYVRVRKPHAGSSPSA
jgi:hypothetical protein